MLYNVIGLARKHMHLFEAKKADVDAGAQGRNKPIVLGQVGIRCKVGFKSRL